MTVPCTRTSCRLVSVSEQLTYPFFAYCARDNISPTSTRMPLSRSANVIFPFNFVFCKTLVFFSRLNNQNTFDTETLLNYDVYEFLYCLHPLDRLLTLCCIMYILFRWIGGLYPGLLPPFRPTCIGLSRVTVVQQGLVNTKSQSKLPTPWVRDNHSTFNNPKIDLFFVISRRKPLETGKLYFSQQPR